MSESVSEWQGHLLSCFGQLKKKRNPINKYNWIQLGLYNRKPGEKVWPEKVNFDRGVAFEEKNGPCRLEKNIKISNKCKMAKNHFSRAYSGSWGVILGASLHWKVVSEFWFRHPKCYFWYPPNPQSAVILAILWVPKMALQVPESKRQKEFNIVMSGQFCTLAMF